MAEKPIIMSSWSVLALLDHRKTQTRRPVKPRPFHPDYPVSVLDPQMDQPDAYRQWIDRRRDGKGRIEYDYNSPLWVPPYQVGDELWVREALFTNPHVMYRQGTQYEADDAMVARLSGNSQSIFKYLVWRWKRDKLPAIFMPKAAARIFRTVTRVRCEQVQDISVADAIAEGVPPQPAGAGGVSGLMCRLECALRDDLPDAPQIAYFAQLWDSIYTEPPFRWIDNPWNFVYDFREEEVPDG